MEFRGQEGAIGEMGFSAAPPPLACASAFSDTGSARYHECLRNHAAALGGHVLDGCGEFMPGPAGDPLKCAACGCHRSFHRKDPSPDDRRLLLLASAHRAAQLPPPARSPRPPSPLLLPPPPHPYASHPSGSGGGTTTESSSEERGPSSAPLPQAYGQLSSSAGAMPRKRFRTKFTPEQKEQMLCFAERLGWRMQKQDEALVEQFCARVGVRRQVLKVWMHNNKHTTITRRQQQQQPGPRQEQEEQTAPQQ